LLTGNDAAVRREASEALAAVGAVAQDAVPALRGALKDPDADVRRNAVAALAKLREQARPALPELIAALADRKLHEPVAELLVKLGPDPAVQRLAEALKDKEPAVRQGAALALGKFGADAKDALGRLDRAIEVERDPDAKKAMRRARLEIRPAQ